MIVLKRYLYSMIQKIIQCRLNMLPSDGQVLMFHRVNSNCRVDELNFSISESTFDELMFVLSKNYEVVAPKCINDSTPKMKILLTFDDAFDDVYYNAFPVLQRYQFPFVVFVAYNLIGKEGYLTSEMILDMNRSEICTWGYHTLNHRMMRGLKKTELRNEIDDGLKMFEKLLSRKVEYFAFPYGSCYAVSRENINYLYQKNFKLLFTTWQSSYNICNIEKTKLVPRINVNNTIAREYIDETTS